MLTFRIPSGGFPHDASGRQSEKSLPVPQAGGLQKVHCKRSINPIYNQGYGRAMLISHILFGGFPHDAPWCQS